MKTAENVFVVNSNGPDCLLWVLSVHGNFLLVLMKSFTTHTLSLYLGISLLVFPPLNSFYSRYSVEKNILTRPGET